jgi:hypothetical protein
LWVSAPQLKSPNFLQPWNLQTKKLLIVKSENRKSGTLIWGYIQKGILRTKEGRILEVLCSHTHNCIEYEYQKTGKRRIKVQMY